MDLESNVFSSCFCQMLLVQYLQNDQQVVAHQFLLSHSHSQQIRYVSAKVCSISHTKCTTILLYLWLWTWNFFLYNLGKKRKNKEPADTFEKLMACEQIADKREEEWMNAFKTTIEVASWLEIAAETCTFGGYFGLGFSFLGCLVLPKHSQPWWFSCTEHSTLQITLLKLSFASILSWHLANRACILATLISWQYLGRVWIHPRSYLRARFTVEMNTCKSGHLSCSMFLNLLAVSSSSSASASSMNLTCSSCRILGVLGFLFRWITAPVCSFFF